MACRINIATSFFHASGKVPNCRTSSDNNKFNLYYLCIAVFFRSARRAIPESTLTLFTNRELSTQANDWLTSAGASISIVPNAEYVSDQFFSNAFPGCLFSLDVIEYLANTGNNSMDMLMLVDPDCIFLRRPQQILDTLERQLCILALEIDYPLNFMLNGHTRASLSLALQKLYSGATIPIRYYGGEFYGLKAELITPLASQVRMIWEWLKHDEQRWLGHQLTEEHVLSLALNNPELCVLPANGTVKRIWTADNYSNVDNREAELDIWHLPAEKNRGFPRLYRKLIEIPNDHELDDDAFLRLALSQMNLSPASYSRWLTRLRVRIRSSIKALLTAVP